MEFLKRELIEDMSQNDERLATESENIWNENCQKAWKLFLKSKKELPKNLVKILEDGFFMTQLSNVLSYMIAKKSSPV